MTRRFALLLGILAAAGVASLALGPAGISPSALVRRVLDPTAPGSEAARALLLDLRLPRTVLTALVGAALAVAGVLLQAYFQNPMAGPYVVGVSSGAGLGVAALAALSGAMEPSRAAMGACALAGGLAVVLIVAVLAERSSERRTESLLLVGLAVAAVASALTSILLLRLPRGPEGVLFWLLGSLAGATWESSILVAAALTLGLTVGLLYAPALDALLWGDETARSVGVAVPRLRRLVLAAATLPTAASVAAAGVIGFLGLMVPHLARGIVGAAHGRLLVASALIGASWLLVADTAARLITAPAEVPVGAITSAVGAPFLVWIVLGRRRSWGSSDGTRRRSSPGRTTTSKRETSTMRSSPSRRSSSVAASSRESPSRPVEAGRPPGAD